MGSRPLFQVIADARARLVDAGMASADAAIDVDLYVRTILGWDRARLLADQRAPAPDHLEPALSAWIRRRAAGEPSAYIVGTREFWGLEFAVSPAVLIPRPETELIVEEALALAPRGLRRLADIGTGSGCLAVALATELPHARIVASDVSADALAVARGNAARHGAADRIRFVRTRYLDGVRGPFDLIAANPPYVRDGDRNALARDVRHEPEVALFGGAEGLRDIAGVLDTAAAVLAPGGWLVMEFGYGQEPQVESLAAARPGLRLAGVRADFQGIARTAVVQREPFI